MNGMNLAMVRVNAYQGSKEKPAKPNKRGAMPVYLQPINHVLPKEARVLDGTLADNTGLLVGGTYLISYEHTGTDEEYGDQYQILNLNQSNSALDTIGSVRALSAPIAQLSEVSE
jgi:hypothetical protein